MFKRFLITLACFCLVVPGIAMAEQIGIFTDNNNDFTLTQIGGTQEQVSINGSGTFTFGNVGTPIDNIGRAAVLT
jgi:hypothetical protein